MAGAVIFISRKSPSIVCSARQYALTCLVGFVFVSAAVDLSIL